MSAGGGDSGQDVELNLAPIIDCFTVLITYLLVTASFISLAAMDVGVSATGTAAPSSTPQGPPPYVLVLEIKQNSDIQISVRGGKLGNEYPFKVTALNGQRDDARLLWQLNDIKARFPDIKEASVTAEPTVIYRDVVKVIRKIQETLPKVLISS